MEREVSLLRCSKLSCYSEFNRMVQAIARNGGEGDIPGTRLQKGTSAEYNFYATLVIMLKQVISNKDPQTQKYELQRVYEWFSLNKPLIKPKTKPSQRKPKVSITKCDSIDHGSLSFSALDRPHTAPPSLYKTGRSFSDGTRNPRSARNRTQSSTKRRSTFTAMYVSRSFCGGLDLIGQTFDQLQLKQTQRTKSQEEVKTPDFVDPSTHLEGRSDTPVRESGESTISLIDLPHSDVLAVLSPRSSGQRPQTAAARSVSLATVFSMAPGVAAQMTLERELNEEFQSNRRRILSGQGPQILHPQQNHHEFIRHHQLVTTPDTDGPKLEPLKPMLYRESDRISTTIATEESTQVKSSGDEDHQEKRGSQQSSPSHNNREPKGKESSNSDDSHLVVKGSEQDSPDNISVKQSSDSKLGENRHPRDVKFCPHSPIPPEVQDTMLNMKVVSSRQSILSQVSLTPRDSPRTRDKEDGNGTSLHIEGQAVRLSAESASQRHKLASSQREHAFSPGPQPMITARLVHESKTEGVNSLSIRPVSLQQHSRKISAAPLKQDLEIDKNDEKNAGRVRSEPDLEKLEDNTALETQDKHQIGGVDQETSGLVEEEKSRQLDVSTLDSTNSQFDESEIHKAKNEESSNLTAAKSEETDTAVSGSQVTPGSSSFEVPQSPIMIIKESSPTPLRPNSLRSSYLHQKSASLRHPSPMNVVSLSFPAEGTGSKHQRSRTEGFLNSDVAKKKTPTIIAGFNRKRYKRLKSPRSVERNKVLSTT